jgi:hypothetical protein
MCVLRPAATKLVIDTENYIENSYDKETHIQNATVIDSLGAV